MHAATQSSHSYDFRKDFSAIAAPGLHRYLRAEGYDPDEPSNEIDDCWVSGKDYIAGLFRGLKSAQSDYREFGASADVEDWTREGVAAYVERRLEGILTDAHNPVTWDDVVETGQRLDREHAAKEKSFIEKLRAAAKPAVRAKAGDPLDAIELAHESDWLQPEGVIGAMADWIMTQMQNPNRPLAVAAALATITPIVGWRNLHSPTGCALNALMAGLGGTAIGKDAMLKLPGRILSKVEIPQRLYSSSDAFSLSAQERIIFDRPAVLLALDEISTNMFPRMFSARANSHETAMKGMHMKLFARNMDDPPFGLTARASGTLEDVADPQFSILAANTPMAFWQSMPETAITDGYLNRWLVFASAPRQSRTVVHDKVPANILEFLRDVALASPDSIGKMFRPKPSMIPWAGDDVRRAWENMRDQLLPLIDSGKRDGFLLGRTAEHAIRLATKHAIGCDGADASVTMTDLRFGAALAVASARVTIAGSAMMVGSEHGKLVARIESLFAGKGEISTNEITRATQNATPRQRRDALEDLRQLGVIEDWVVAPGKHGGRPKTGYRKLG